MAVLKWMLALLGLVLFGSAGALVVYDVYVASQLRRLLKRKSEGGDRRRRDGAGTPWSPAVRAMDRHRESTRLVRA